MVGEGTSFEDDWEIITCKLESITTIAFSLAFQWLWFTIVFAYQWEYCSKELIVAGVGLDLQLILIYVQVYNYH